MNKKLQMADLVHRRKSRQGCVDGCEVKHFHYFSLGHFQGGLFECDVVSPTSIVANNLDADVMLMGQDWDAEEGCRRPPNYDVALGYDPEWPTNKNVDSLLEVGLKLSRKDVYWTNLFPFIKGGDASAPIPVRELRNAATDFGIPQIEIVRPRVVVCFGLATYNAIAWACEQPRFGRVSQAIETPFTHTGSGATIWCQSHPGALGRIQRERAGGKDQVRRDWERMAEALGR